LLTTVLYLTFLRLAGCLPVIARSIAMRSKLESTTQLQNIHDVRFTCFVILSRHWPCQCRNRESVQFLDFLIRFAPFNQTWCIFVFRVNFDIPRRAILSMCNKPVCRNGIQHTAYHQDGVSRHAKQARNSPSCDVFFAASCIWQVGACQEISWQSLFCVCTDYCQGA